MDDLKQAFKEGEKEGRTDTRHAINNMREGNGIPLDYIKKFVARSMFGGFILGIGTFIYYVYHHGSLLFSLLVGFGVCMLTMVILSFLSVIVLKLAARRK